MLQFTNWQKLLDNINDNDRIENEFKATKNFKEAILWTTVECLSREDSISSYFNALCLDIDEKSVETAKILREKGNELYTKKQMKQAISLYNECIHVAPFFGDQSHQLALGLGNRSAALYQLQEYKLARSDAELSLKLGYPEHLQHKLVDRIQRCIDAVNSSSNDTTITNDCNNDNLVDANSNIDVCYDEDAGRYLKTHSDLPIGTTLIVEKPYSVILLPEFYPTHCQHCIKELGLVSFPCPQCVEVRFCSLGCLREAWFQYHWLECAIMNLLHSIGIAHLSLRMILQAGLDLLTEVQPDTHDDFPEPSHLIEQVSLRTYNNCSNNSMTSAKKNYMSVYNLLPQVEHMTTEDFLHYSMTASLLLRCLQSAQLFTNPPTKDNGKHLCNKVELLLTDMDSVCSPTEVHDVSSELSDCELYVGGLLLRHVCQLVCNAHAITRIGSEATESNSNGADQNVEVMSQQRLATAIYPVASLMNHNCKPNIISSFAGSELTVRSIEHLNPGDEIFNCYGPHCKRMLYSERQQVLQQQYFFACKCDSCRNEGMQEVRYLAYCCPSCKGAFTSQVNDEDVMICQDCAHQVTGSKSYTDAFDKTQQDFIQGVQTMAKGKFKDAISMLHLVYKQQTKLLYRYNRHLGNTCDALARAYATIADYKNSGTFLSESLKCTKYIYGADSIEYGNELHKQAAILFQCQLMCDALESAQKAERIIYAHYGKKHATSTEISNMVHEIKMVLKSRKQNATPR